jgi:hypothetical protein
MMLGVVGVSGNGVGVPLLGVEELDIPITVALESEFRKGLTPDS